MFLLLCSVVPFSGMAEGASARHPRLEHHLGVELTLSERAFRTRPGVSKINPSGPRGHADTCWGGVGMIGCG